MLTPWDKEMELESKIQVFYESDKFKLVEIKRHQNSDEREHLLKFSILQKCNQDVIFKMCNYRNKEVIYKKNKF